MIYRDTYMEINLNTLHENIQKILAFKEASFAFVLKANAYGLGAKVIARELNTYEEIKYVAVASLNEALEIKKYTTKKIWILGYLNDEMLIEASIHNFTTTIFDYHQAFLLEDGHETFIKIDTGFHRLGKSTGPDLVQEIKDYFEKTNIKIKGIFTHLKLQRKNIDLEQIYRFDTFYNELDTLKSELEYISLSDSIAFTRHDITNENLFRIGALMFGLQSKKEISKISVKPIFSLKTRVSRVHELAEDSTVGYGSTKYKKGTVIATIPIGYSDGLFRDMKDAYVTIDNHKCKYLGILGMDQSMVDITGLEVEKNSDVIIYGNKGISLDELSIILGTNKNEILSKLSARTPRVYIMNDDIKYVLDDVAGELYEY